MVEQLKKKGRLPLYWTIAAALLLGLASCFSSSEFEPGPAAFTSDMVFDSSPQLVLLVSMDGMRPDAIDASASNQILKLKEMGVYSDQAQAVMPSVTLINHASMISGVTPDKHQVDWNVYLPEKGTLAVPTLFDRLKQVGKRTALVAGKEKFKHFNRPHTLDQIRWVEGSPDQIADQAIETLDQLNPNFLMVHFPHGDSEGHRQGWMSDEQLQAFNDSDRALSKILSHIIAMGIAAQTAVIVTADHGGHEKTHGTSASEDVQIPWIAAGAGVPRTGRIDSQVMTYDTAATVLHLFSERAPEEWNWDGVPIF